MYHEKDLKSRWKVNKYKEKNKQNIRNTYFSKHYLNIYHIYSQISFTLGGLWKCSGTKRCVQTTKDVIPGNGCDLKLTFVIYTYEYQF